MNVDKIGDTYVVEWFEEEHVFDAAGLSESDISALAALKQTHDELDATKRAEMRGMLHLAEDGLTNGYLPESAEVFMRIWEMFQKERKK